MNKPSRPAKIVLLPGQGDASLIVAAALERSFTRAQMATDHAGAVVVAVDPDDHSLEVIRGIAEQGGKAVIFGRPGPKVAEWLGLSVTPLGAEQQAWDMVTPWQEAPARIRYFPHPLWRGTLPYASRPLWRFDFTDEWNNLGYGRICADGGAFSLAGLARSTGDGKILGAIEGTNWCYAMLSDRNDHSVLWVGRSVGPVDGLDWRMVEGFIADWRAEDLPCLPCLEDVPHGFDASVTMRLDCDQDISSARPLFELYREYGVPFSLAIVTGLEMDGEDLVLLDEVAQHGAVLSHSVSHPADWGGALGRARSEALEARAWLERRTGGEVPYAVSPFHQNSRAALEGVAQAGVRAFIGGVIHNDPEFLMGRSGVVPFGSGLISQSQQCMLHGDCYHHAGNSLHVYRAALASHLAARGAMGYLDHPQSASYQYGWRDIAEQVAVHREWLEHLARFRLWRPSASQSLDFSVHRARTALWCEGEALRCSQPPVGGQPRLSAIWKGRVHAV